MKKVLENGLVFTRVCLLLLSTSFFAIGQQTESQTLGDNSLKEYQLRLDEIKVRWKKAALENCPGVPCVTTAVSGAPTAVVATSGNASASVAFVAPANNGGSTITGYTVTSSPGGITATGATSPINVTGLTNGTAYTFTVVATNAVGNSVASAASTAATPASPTACGSISTVIDYNGNSYTTVAIGTQCWTKSNLKVTNYNDGTLIGDVTLGPWNTGTNGAHTEYVSNLGVTEPNYVNTFGYLYNWYAVSDSRKLCPIGWHVPTDSDWNKLVNFLDSSSADTSSTSSTQSTTAGTKLKKNDAALWSTNTGTNTSGFSALPGGYRNSSSSVAIRNFAYFWSATDNADPSLNTFAWNRTLTRSSGNVDREEFTNKSFFLSVRCLKD